VGLLLNLDRLRPSSDFVLAGSGNSPLELLRRCHDLESQTLDLSWSQISEITYAKGRKILLQQRDGEAIELIGLPKPKKLAATLRNYL
jgi:hypothetical protein